MEARLAALGGSKKANCDEVGSGWDKLIITLD